MTFLVAYGMGSLIGLLALSVERWALGYSALSLAAASAYGLLGGTAAGLARITAGALVGARGARLASVAVSLSFIAVNLIYILNVKLLPGEPYFSVKSLMLDCVVGALLAGVLVGISWSGVFAERRERGRAPLALIGASLLIANVSLVAASVRNDESAPRTRVNGSGPNLLLIVLDSARRDHMSLYGYPSPTSARLDQWMEGARIYEQAFAASSWTVPTVAALMGQAWLRPDLPRRLAHAGYQTASFTDNPHLIGGSPLTAGFDYRERSVTAWRRPLHRTVVGALVERVHGGSDNELVDRAIAWARTTNGPVFVYAHLMDSHTPFKHAPLDGRRRRGRQIQYPTSGMQVTADEADDIVARYDAGLRIATTAARRLLDAAAGWGRPFVAIVTADHGESLGDQGRWFHGHSLAAELLAVPLVVGGAGVEAGRVPAPVAHTSITATLLAAAGAACAECTGSDLRRSTGDPFVSGELPPVFSYGVSGGYKLIVDRRSGTRRLYDLRRDPLEQQDRSADEKELSAALAGALSARGSQSPSPEVLERIRSLGYFGGADGRPLSRP